MLTSIFMTMYWAKVVQTLAVIITSISGIVAGILWGIWGFNQDDYPDLSEKQIKDVKKWATIFAIIFVIFLAIAILVPDKSTILTFAAIHELDKYNSTHTSSSLTPDAAYSTLDSTVKNLSSILNGVADKVKTLTK